MGGEWNFAITTPPKDGSVLDLKAYQKFLKEIKAEYEIKFIEEARLSPWATYVTHDIDAEVAWCNDDSFPPEDNIFAKFEYKCTKHTWHKKNLELACGKAVWCLFWDPTIVEDCDLCSDVHARCAPEGFKMISHKIQSKIVSAFPQHFYLYWGDGISGYGDITIELGTL